MTTSLVQAISGNVKQPAALAIVDDHGEVTAYTLVDADRFDDLRRYRWRLDTRGYAINEQSEYLHRHVLGLRWGDGLHGHHVNGERLDNRSENLRALDPEEHQIAHGRRTRVPITSKLHPAIDRGHARWLRDYRESNGPVEDGERIVGAMAPRSLPKTLSTDQVEALMRRPNKRAPTGLRNLAMMTLMYRCGLRVSEACGLHLRDVRWRDGQIHLRGEITKGGREAFIYMDAPTQELLERHVERRREYAAGKPNLFNTLKGGPVSRHYAFQMVRRYARKAGLGDKVHPHMLRHSYATELLREGFNIREVQQLLRHADIRTTAIYLHVVDTELARKIRERS